MLKLWLYNGVVYKCNDIFNNIVWGQNQNGKFNMFKKEDAVEISLETYLQEALNIDK